MPRDAEQDRLAVFARDFAKLYTRFVADFPDPASVTLDEFGVIFDASHLEYLHYCGGTTIERPYYPSITEDLLLLSASYLALPPAVAPRATQTFGLLLSLFLFSTQPARRRGELDADAAGAAAEAESPLPPSPTAATASTTSRAAARRTTPTTAIGEGRNGSGGAATTAASAPAAPSTPSPSLCLPMRRVPIPTGCVRRLLEQLAAQLDAAASESPADVAPQRLSRAEATALLALRRADGWHIEPYLPQGKSVTALLAAHHAIGAPLLPTSAAAPVPEQLFAAALTARTVLNAAAPPEALGGADSVFRDPTFLELRQEYEAARRRLLEG